MDIEKAKKMFSVISQTPMGSKVREEFCQMAEIGDVDGIWNRLNECIKNRPEVGQSVEQAGKTSFEMLLPEVKSIKEAP